MTSKRISKFQLKPCQPKGPQMKQKTCFWICCYRVFWFFAFLFCPKVQSADRCLELAVLKHVEALVCLEQFPRMTLQVVAQQHRSDGSDTAVCLNAVWLALLEAGIPMKSTALAVGIGFGKDGLRLDPNYEEEKNLPAGATALVDCHSADVMSMLPTKGPLPQHHWSTAVCLAQAGAKMLEGFLRQAWAKKLEKLPKC